jgi:hypothetical protein
MIQEKRLMMRFNRGDAAALRDIYALYKDELVTLASALLHDKTTAEDAVHDVFAMLIDRQCCPPAVSNTEKGFRGVFGFGENPGDRNAEAAGISHPCRRTAAASGCGPFGAAL